MMRANAGVARLVKRLICNHRRTLILTDKYRHSIKKVECFLYVLKRYEAALIGRLRSISCCVAIAQNIARMLEKRLLTGCQSVANI